MTMNLTLWLSLYFLLDNRVRIVRILAISAPMGVDFNALPASGGTFAAEVAPMGGATGWTAVASFANPGYFLTVGGKDVPNEEQSIDYGVNTGVARTGQVTFTPVGGTGIPAARTVEFRQLGAAPTLSVGAILMISR